MTKILRRKMIRDLKENLIQFLAIFIMCFFAMFILESFDSDAEGYGRSLDNYYKQTDFEDLVMTSEGFTPEDLIDVKTADGIRDAERRATINGKIKLDTEKKIELNFIEENNISRMLLTDGEPFESGKSGIWIDSDFAGRQGIAVGDSISLKCDGVEFSEIVKGIMDNPDHAYFMIDDTYTEPDRGDYGYAFLDAGEYPGRELVFDRIYVKLKDVENQFYLTERDEKLIEKSRIMLMGLVSKNTLAVISKQKEAGYNSIYADMKSDRTMEMVFPVLFVVIAILGIMTTMTRLVMKQRTVIGTLKALGFSQSTVMLHYMSYAAVISLAGGVLGTMAGWFILGRSLHGMMADYYNVPGVKMLLSYRIGLVIAGMVLMAVLTNYISCRSLLVQRASEILRPAPPSATGAGFLEKTPLWKHFSFATKWNIRDINRNRVRTVASILGIMLTAALMFTSFGANELNHAAEDWGFYELTPAGYNINFSPGTGYGTVYDYAREYRGQMVEVKEAELYGDSISKIFTVTVVDEGNLYRFQDEDGSYVSLPESGAAISNKAAEALDLGIGDFVSFRYTEKPDTVRCRIELIYKTPDAQGIAMKRSFYESLGLDFQPSAVYTDISVPSSFATEREEISSVISKEALIRSLKKKNAGTDEEVTYTMAIAVIIGIVVMYNLGILSFIEKVREIATLKVLGFETKRIRWILQQQNIFVTGIGTALGLLAGMKLLVEMMSALTPDSDFIYKVSPLPYILAFALSFLLSLVVNGLLSSKVKDINMVEALKGVE